MNPIERTKELLNIINNNMDKRLLKLYNQSIKKPKKIFNKKGDYTATFLKWNLQQIKEGRTTIYADNNYLINTTGRRIKKKFDTRFKTKTLSKKFKKLKIIDSRVIELEGDLEEEYLPENYSTEGYYNGEPINYKEFLYKKLQQAGVVAGEFVKIIVKVYDLDNNIQVGMKSDPEVKEKIPDIRDQVKIVDSLHRTYNTNYNIIINNSFFAPVDLKDYEDRMLFLNLMYDSAFPNVIAYLLDNRIKCRFIITKLVNLSELEIVQKFAEGKEHCLLNPILCWSMNMLNNDDIKDKNKYATIVNKLVGKKYKSKEDNIGLIEKYKDGIPETELNNLCEELRIKIKVQYPLKRIKYKEFSCSRKPLKKFTYINTKYNHVEHITTRNYKDMVDNEMNEDDINIKFNELRDKKEYFIFGRNKVGISWIQTYDKIYRVKDHYNETVNKFMEDNDFKFFKIDAVKEKDKTKFIENGCHFNGTTDFQELPSIDNYELRHIDMKKAYSQFKKCKYYKGFAVSMTDLRMVDNYNEAGLYYIDNLNLDNANPKFKYYNSNMIWFVDKNIYTDAELRFLKDMGAKFKVRCGCFGIRGDFEFNDEMLNTKLSYGVIGDKELKISYYAMFIGKCASINYNSKINMYGSKKYFECLQDDYNDIRYDEWNKEATILYPKKEVYHLKHITAQVTAYQRLNLMNQLLQMDLDKIIRVCVDGIYYYNHDCPIDDIFQDKIDDMTFNNSPCETYLSNIFERVEDKKNPFDTSLSDIKFGNKRSFYKKELVIGGGGNGKSTREFLDYGHSNILYTAPSWKLARNVENKIMTNDNGEFSFPLNPNIKVTVEHRYLEMDYEYDLQSKFNVVLHDECSQKTEATKLKCFNANPYAKHIFLGDLGYQLEPVIDYNGLKHSHIKEIKKAEKEDKEIETDFITWINIMGHYEMKKIGFDNTLELTKDYRAVCPKLREVKKELRKFIDKGRYLKKDESLKVRQQAIDYIKNIIPVISDEELKNKYNKYDMILASTHEHIKKYNKMFSHLEKYLVKNNTKEFSNGEIIYNKPDKNVLVMKYKDCKEDVTHCYTVHAIQGETLEKNRKLFINTDKMFSDRMLYTAVSRARTLDQIYLV